MDDYLMIIWICNMLTWSIFLNEVVLDQFVWNTHTHTQKTKRPWFLSVCTKPNEEQLAGVSLGDQQITFSTRPPHLTPQVNLAMLINTCGQLNNKEIIKS